MGGAPSVPQLVKTLVSQGQREMSNMQNMRSRKTEATLRAVSVIENLTYLEATLGRKFPLCGRPHDNATTRQGLANSSTVIVMHQGLTLFRNLVNKLELVY